ncbi:Tat pathway signal sequence domain protein [Streptomyces sp. URMC 123]|uniref:Tat pathway signal sequence domain protein n=1 Tax=Streptomyces sp. URMC 123 TaxID=3423403 RepID=UPI003F1B36F0
MRRLNGLLRRHLGTVVAGGAVALAATAAMIGVTLPSDAGAANETSAAARGATAAGRDSPGDTAGDTPGGRDRGAPAPGVVEAPAPRGEQGAGRDALTDAEVERAERLALAGRRTAGENVRGRPGPQWLGTELAEPRPTEVGQADPPRRAEIAQYDYGTETLVTTVVNLTTGAVEDTRTARGEQPPPTRDEAVEAVRVLLASPLADGLKKDFKDATDKDLTDPGQLETTAMTYRVGEENSGPPALRACGEHRCVRLFPKVRNGPWIDARHLIVDLSDRTVGRVQ